jgi:hypothetical protein
MKNWVFAAALVAVASGCGSDGVDGLLGKWAGSAAGMTVNLDVVTHYDGGGYYGGTLSTSNGNCLTAGMLVGRMTDATVELSASGSGAQSQTSIMRITGELTDGQIVGLVSMSGELEAACDLAKTTIVLRRP